MIKKTITYKTFDGKTLTEDFYFHMTKSEMIGLSLGKIRGVDRNNIADVYQTYGDLVKLSYGKKSLSGKAFIKSKEVTDEFIYSNAYDSLLTELSTNEKLSKAFITGIMPKEFEKELKVAFDKENKDNIININEDTQVVLTDHEN